MDGNREWSAKNLLLGAAGAVVGVCAMDAYFKLLKRRSSRSGDNAGEEARSEESRHALDDISIAGIKKREKEPATATLGRLGYHAVKGRDPDRETSRRLSTAIHWAYGVAVGGLYGLLRGDDRAALDIPAGLGYGAALWLIGDEVMVPVLGLSEGPTAHAPADHLKALGAHLVYGVATSATTQALHRVA